jgi:hypothetical protein
MLTGGNGGPEGSGNEATCIEMAGRRQLRMRWQRVAPPTRIFNHLLTRLE